MIRRAWCKLIIVGRNKSGRHCISSLSEQINSIKTPYGNTNEGIVKLAERQLYKVRTNPLGILRHKM